MKRAAWNLLAKEIWTVGIKAKRKAEGYSAGDTWKDIQKQSGQMAAWRAVAMYVDANFKRIKRKRVKK